MPNHVEHNVTITGPAEDLAEFVRVSTAGYVVKKGDKEVARSRSLSLVDVAGDEELMDEGRFSFGALTGVPDDYAHNWYDRAIELWGTKWGAYDVENFDSYQPGDESLSFSFNTAWSSPTPYFEVFAERFPTLVLTASFIDEGDCFVGWGLAINGAYQSHELASTDLVGEHPEYPENDTDEAQYEAWLDAHNERETRVRDVLLELAQGAKSLA